MVFHILDMQLGWSWGLTVIGWIVGIVALVMMVISKSEEEAKLASHQEYENPSPGISTSEF